MPGGFFIAISSGSAGSAFWSSAELVTVAILAQGTSWAVAVTQAFLLAGSILVKCACAWPGLDRTNPGLGAQLSVLSGPAGASKCHPVHFPGCVGS